MKNITRKVLTLILTMAIVFGIPTVAASAASVPAIQIDGKALSIASAYGTPYVDTSSRTQVPVRIVAESLGAAVVWDQSIQSAVINGTTKIKLGANTITTQYGTIAMDTTSVALNGRIYVPVRFLCEALGYDVNAAVNNGAVTANIITKVDLNISAAASLKNAMAEIQSLYLTQKPNTKLTPIFAASGTLQTQIEQGAPVDVFFSAATSNMNTLKTKGLLIDSTIKNLLGNDLVLIIPKDSTLAIGSFTDITNSSVKSIGLGDPGSVPAGKYAQEVFTYYNVWDAVKTKAVFGTPVTQILTWVETGNVDCGVVYSTDALSSTKVKIVATAIDASHTSTIYPAAVVKASTHAVAAADFVNFLSSPEAKAVFKKFGFSTL